jgi:hypothetical protein
VSSSAVQLSFNFNCSLDIATFDEDAAAFHDFERMKRKREELLEDEIVEMLLGDDPDWIGEQVTLICYCGF